MFSNSWIIIMWHEMFGHWLFFYSKILYKVTFISFYDLRRIHFCSVKKKIDWTMKNLREKIFLNVHHMGDPLSCFHYYSVIYGHSNRCTMQGWCYGNCLKKSLDIQNAFSLFSHILRQTESCSCPMIVYVKMFSNV